MVILWIHFLTSYLAWVDCSLMSRIGLRLGGKPAHESQLEHVRRVSWAVKELQDEEKRQQDSLTFLHAEDREGRPPPCVGICYYKKLQALQAKEDLLTSHNYVLKQEEEGEEEDCLTGHCAPLPEGDLDKVDDLVIFEPIDLDGKLVGLDDATSDQAEQDRSAVNTEADASIERESRRMEMEVSREEVESNQVEMESNQVEKESNQVLMKSNMAEMDSNQAEMEPNPAEMESNPAEMESNQAELDSNQPETVTSPAEMEFNRSEMESNQAEIESNTTENGIYQSRNGI